MQGLRLEDSGLYPKNKKAHREKGEGRCEEYEGTAQRTRENELIGKKGAAAHLRMVTKSLQ